MLHHDQLALGRTCCFLSPWDGAGGRPGAPCSRERAPHGSPCRGWSVG